MSRLPLSPGTRTGTFPPGLPRAGPAVFSPPRRLNLLWRTHAAAFIVFRSCCSQERASAVAQAQRLTTTMPRRSSGCDRRDARIPRRGALTPPRPNLSPIDEALDTAVGTDSTQPAAAATVAKAGRLEAADQCIKERHFDATRGLGHDMPDHMPPGRPPDAARGGCRAQEEARTGGCRAQEDAARNTTRTGRCCAQEDAAHRRMPRAGGSAHRRIPRTGGRRAPTPCPTW